MTQEISQDERKRRAKWNKVSRAKVCQKLIIIFPKIIIIKEYKGKIKKKERDRSFLPSRLAMIDTIVQLIGAINCRILIYRRKFSPRSNVKIDRRLPTPDGFACLITRRPKVTVYAISWLVKMLFSKEAIISNCQRQGN